MSCYIDDVVHFDITVSKDTVDEDVKTFISQVKKLWDISKLTKIILHGGYINTLIGFHVKSDNEKENYNSDIFLLKIYGANSDASIDRKQELMTFRELSQNNVAPQLYCTFTNGFCYEYIHGKVCNQEDFKDFEISKLSAECMARLHSVKLSDAYVKDYPRKSDIFLFISDHIELIPKKYKNDIKQSRFVNEVPSTQVLYDELNRTINMCPKLTNISIVLCHNDLNIPNLIYDKKRQMMHCIDYEFAGPNYAAYDIANHFTEFAGNSGTVDFDLIPNESTQKQWLNIYLLKYKEKDAVPAGISEEDVHMLYEQVKYFILVSHLVWGIWALVQVDISEVDFDFMNYAILRINAYYKHKNCFFKNI